MNNDLVLRREVSRATLFVYSNSAPSHLLNTKKAEQCDEERIHRNLGELTNLVAEGCSSCQKSLFIITSMP